MPNILSVPGEVLLSILEYLEPPFPPYEQSRGYFSAYDFPPDKAPPSNPESGLISSLKAVCLTCVRLRSIAQPILYRNIRIPKASEYKLLETLLKRPELGLHIRAIRTVQFSWSRTILQTVLDSFEERPSDLSLSFGNVLRQQLTRREFVPTGADNNYVSPSIVLLAHAPNLRKVRIRFHQQHVPWSWILGGPDNLETAGMEDERRQVPKTNTFKRENNNGDTTLLIPPSYRRPPVSIRYLSILFQQHGILTEWDFLRLSTHLGLETLCVANAQFVINGRNISAPVVHASPSCLTSLRVYLPCRFEAESLEFLLCHLPKLCNLSIECHVQSMDMSGYETGLARIRGHGNALREYGHNLVFLDLCLLSRRDEQALRTGLGSLQGLRSLRHLLISRQDFYDGEFLSIFALGSNIGEGSHRPLQDMLPRTLESICLHDGGMLRPISDPWTLASPSIRSHFRQTMQELQDLRTDDSFPNLKTCGMNIQQWRMEMPTY